MTKLCRKHRLDDCPYGAAFQHVYAA